MQNRWISGKKPTSAATDDYTYSKMKYTAEGPVEYASVELKLMLTTPVAVLLFSVSSDGNWCLYYDNRYHQGSVASRPMLIIFTIVS